MRSGRITLAREALAHGVPVRLRVFGSSMSPTLIGGTQVEIRPLTAAPLPGDIVAWTRLSRLVVHRVVRVEPSGSVVTRGDACCDPDPTCPPEALLGRVVLPSGKPPRRSFSIRARDWIERLLRWSESRLTKRGR